MNKINDIIVTMKKKIPILPLTIHFILVKSIYNDFNSNNSIYRIAFWIYFPILCLLTCIWEGIHSYFRYIKIYPNRTNCEVASYTAISIFVSLWVFIATCYYIENGIPFSYLFPYNNIISSIVFFISYGLVSCISYVEHFIWSKISNNQVLDNNQIQDNNQV